MILSQIPLTPFSKGEIGNEWSVVCSVRVKVE